MGAFAIIGIILIIIIGAHTIKNPNGTPRTKYMWGTFTKKELVLHFDEFKRVMMPYVSYDFAHYTSQYVQEMLERCLSRYKDDYKPWDTYNEFYKFAIESTGYYERRVIIALLIYRSPNRLSVSGLRPREEERDAYNQMRLAVTKTLISSISDIPPAAFEYLSVSPEEIQKDYERALDALK